MSNIDLEDEFSLGEEDADLDDLIDDEVANSPHHNKYDEEFNPDDIRTQEAAILTQVSVNQPPTHPLTRPTRSPGHAVTLWIRCGGGAG